MDQYPTEEEEYELVYGDDLDAMDELDEEPPPGIRNVPSVPVTPSSAGNANGGPRASSSCSNYRTPGQLGTIDESPLASPALSVITRGSSTAHKRLFDTPGPSSQTTLPDGVGKYGRAASTPFPGSTASGNALATLQQMDANPRKRRLEALFGDIQDIEEEPFEEDYIYSSQKKTKTEEEQDMELIERILEARQRYNAVANPMKPSMLSRAEALHRFKMDNISLEPPKWPSMTIKRDDKTSVYVRFHSEEFEKEQIDEIHCTSGNGYNGLLGAEKERIWREANEIVAKRLTEPANAIVAPTPEVEAIVIPSESNVLWVEKYRPRRYIDLLSDETTNRSLLQWLKLWDKAVFGREPVKKQKDQKTQLSNFNKKTGRFESNGGWVKGARKARSTLNTELDEHGCPVQKIALLSGPPGLGKTTLAHTIARHAGYAVREVNASDDRSPEAFRLALENGTQMKSVLNEEKRPNCIVLDEIDGAPVAAIEFLLRFIAGNVGSQKAAGTKKTGKAARDKFILKRPIICICNDMYAPALRQLRLVAYVVNFPPTEGVRLAERLLVIAKKERIITDLTSMLALAEKTGNDVRACLSMLQFFACVKKPIRLTDVLKCNVGQKDRQKGLFSIWSSIFQIQRPKKTITVDPNATETELVTLTDMSATTRMSSVLQVVTMAGDYERLTQGVYENYLHQKMPDADMCGVAEATEWFSFNDRLQRTINQLQNYAIYPYLAYAFVMWHYLFATLAWPKINFPSKGYEHSQKLASTKLIMTGLRKGLSAHLKGIGEGAAVLIDTIPMLKRVINPSLRSVSLQLLSQKEKSDLTHTVEVMADFGLNYIQLKTPEGTYQYQLNPDLDQLCSFSGGVGTAGQSSTYFGKQIVAREVELEQMRRAQPKLIDGGKNGRTAAGTTNTSDAKPGWKGLANGLQHKENAAPELGKKGKKEARAADELPNHLRTLKPKQIVQKTKQVVSKDFFGRISTKETVLSVKEGGTDAIVKSPIWYRYKEGFNNAVRKDVTLQDLM